MTQLKTAFWIVVSVVLLAFNASAADLIGNWNGSVEKWTGTQVDLKGGTTAGAQDYISLYGRRPVCTNGLFAKEEYTIAVLQPWNAAQLWIGADSTDNDSTGTLSIAEWLGNDQHNFAVVHWKTTDDSATNQASFALTWQTRLNANEAWYSAYSLINQDSITEQAYVDTIYFSDPDNCAPEARLYIDPGTLMGVGQYTKFSAWIELFRSPTQ